nr:MAG TPA: hypothetical protein [Caudoviricetes sp.]
MVEAGECGFRQGREAGFGGAGGVDAADAVAFGFTPVKHGLGGGFNGGAVRLPALGGFGRQGGKRKIVVHHAAGILVSAFQTASHSTHKGVVHGAAQYAEMVERGIGDDERAAVGDNIGFDIAYGVGIILIPL